MSCGKFSDGTSIWKEGGWIVPALTFVAGLIFLFFGIKAWLSGSSQYQKVDGVDRLVHSDKRVPFFSVGQVLFAIAFFIATIVIIIVQNLEK